MKTYTADTVCEFLNKNIKTAQKLSELLNAVNITAETNGHTVKAQCSHCQKIKVEVVLSDEGTITWNCKNCRSRCGYHPSLTGLYRSHYKTISPNDAGKNLIDKYFGQLPETDLKLNLRGSAYDGKPLHQIPPSHLLWAVKGSDVIEEIEVEKLKSYLRGNNDKPAQITKSSPSECIEESTGQVAPPTAMKTSFSRPPLIIGASAR